MNSMYLMLAYVKYCFTVVCREERYIAGHLDPGHQGTSVWG